jgi:hypothetical protein
MKKYLLTKTTKKWMEKTLFQIKAKKSFGDVAEGELGGWIEKEDNLSHSGDAWVYGNAQVYGNAWVYGNAQVYGDAWVYGNAWVSGDAWVYGNAQVSGNAWVYGELKLSAGFFFGMRHNKEKIKYKKVGVKSELIYIGKEAGETIAIGNNIYDKHEVEVALRNVKSIK